MIKLSTDCRLHLHVGVKIPGWPRQAANTLSMLMMTDVWWWWRVAMQS